MPHEYYKLKEGEKMVIRAFYEFTMEQRIESEEKIENARRMQRLRNR